MLYIFCYDRLNWRVPYYEINFGNFFFGVYSALCEVVNRLARSLLFFIFAIKYSCAVDESKISFRFVGECGERTGFIAGNRSKNRASVGFVYVASGHELYGEFRVGFDRSSSRREVLQGVS